MTRRPASTRRRQRATAREAALALVARRMLSEVELRTALGRRGFTGAQIDDAAQLCRSYGYVNDDAYADAVLREAQRSGRGSLWVAVRLRSRGIDEAIVNRTERAAEPEAASRAHALVLRRFGEPGRLAPGDRERAYRYLVGRGFAAESALRVLGEP